MDSQCDRRLSSNSFALRALHLTAFPATAVATENSPPPVRDTMYLESQSTPADTQTTSATSTAVAELVENEPMVTQGTMLPPNLQLLCAARDSAMKSLPTSREEERQEQQATILALAAAYKTKDWKWKSDPKKKRRRADDDISRMERNQPSKRTLKESENAPSEQRSSTSFTPVVKTAAACQKEEPNPRENNKEKSSSSSNHTSANAADGNHVPAESFKSSILALVESCKREQEELKARKKLDAQAKRPRIVREPENKQYFDLTPEDIIFGRGTGSTKHNEHFRKTQVATRHLAYRDGSNSEQTAIVRELVDWVKNQKGRFLHKDAIGWYEVTEEAAMLKVRTMVREYKPRVEDE